MNLLIALTLVLTAGLNFILVVSVIPFVREEYKNRPLLIWLSSVGLFSISGFYTAALYFFAPSHFNSPSPLSILGVFSLVVSYSGAIYFFPYLSKEIGWKKIGQVCLSIITINAALVQFAILVPPEFRLIATACWGIILSSWLLYQLNSSQYPQGEYLIYSLKILSVGTILPAFFWILLVLDFNYQLVPFSSKEKLMQLGDLIRVTRNLSAPLSFSIMFIYWMKYDSIHARRAKEDKNRVLSLLHEKDRLIYELGKVNSLASAGALAGGLAHELNQYLARIQLNADNALNHAASNPVYEVFQNPLKRILNANKEAAGVIGALRRTFKARESHQLHTEIADTVRDVTNIYRSRILQSQIELRVDTPDQLGVIDWGDQLSIVLSNLLLNAIEALDASSKPNKIMIITCEFIDYLVLIKIFDNGSAIHPSRVDKIFTLFSTTKKEGIGIGLWLSKSITEKNHGDLSFENINEDGVQFILKIPLSDPAWQSFSAIG